MRLAFSGKQEVAPMESLGQCQASRCNSEPSPKGAAPDRPRPIAPRVLYILSYAPLMRQGAADSE